MELALAAQRASDKGNGLPCQREGGEEMHYLAAALLLVQFALLWILDETVEVVGLEYLAWAVWILSMILLFLPMPTLRSRGNVQEGQSYVETESLVESGLYALVRHPQYLGWMLMYVVVFLFEPNWVLALLGVLGAACVVLFTRQEEARLVEKFGEPYTSYMERVPRFNLAAGIIRRLGARGEVQAQE
jgi:protein-S-isoprenylcysteine O-methyltransferase Ste14